MRTNLFAILLILLSLLTGIASAECDKFAATPQVIKSAEVRGFVSLDATTGIYSYEYSVRNGDDSTGCIKRLEVDVTKGEKSVELSSEGLVDFPKHITRVRDRWGDNIPMVPVAFPDLPRKKLPNIGEVTIWDAGTTVYGAIAWSSSLQQYISPGEETTGFIMTSYGPPAIRDYKVKPWYIAKDQDVLNMGVSEDDLIGDVNKYFTAFYDSIAYKGKTLGPTAPPAELDPAAFLKGIIDMKHEAYSLGWITSEGIEKSLDAKLDSALKKLQGGQNNAAANVLKAFINEVEAQGCATYEDCPAGKHLKPEAYGLLKYNAQYLIDNLK